MGECVERVETRLVTKSLITSEDLAKGIGKVSQVRPSGELELTQLNVTELQGCLVVEKVSQLLNQQDLNYINPNLLGTTKVVLVSENGLFYKYDEQKQEWYIISEGLNTYNTIDDLQADPTGQPYIIVSDLDRGGIFIYDSTQKETNNGGTIINGWVRQYTGSANVKWFGATGNGSTDDTQAIQNALNSVNSIFIPKGTFKISSTLALNANNSILGNAGSVITSEQEITLIKLGNFNTIRDVELQGSVYISTQIGMLIDGGETNTACNESRIENVVFRNIGGSGVKVTNISGISHYVSNSVFTNCKAGVYVDVTGSGLSVTSSSFLSNTIGVNILGTDSTFEDCSFNSNGNAVSFATGLSVKESGITFSACRFSSSVETDIVSANYAGLNVLFNMCKFTRPIYLTQTDSFKFVNCSLLLNTIRYNIANNNTFFGCYFKQVSIVNDYSSSQTCNYYFDCQFDSMQSSTECVNGGVVEVKNSTAYSIPNSDAINVIPFDTVITNAMPYHSSFTKYSFFDSTNNCFDLTQTQNLINPDSVYVDVQLHLSSVDSATLDGLSVGLYKVEDNSQAIDKNSLDLTKLIALTTHAWSSYTTGSPTRFCGVIPRGKYKLIIANNSKNGINIVADGTTYKTSGKTAYRVKFWGI